MVMLSFELESGKRIEYESFCVVAFGISYLQAHGEYNSFMRLLHHSQEFRNTAATTEAVAKGLRSAGCTVDLLNTDHGRFDITRFPQYDCAAFGSPDY